MDLLDKFLTLQQSLTKLGVENSDPEKDDSECRIKAILKSCCELLNVARASVWLFNNNKSSIICQFLYIKKNDLFESGLQIAESSCPMYFKSLNTSRVINADNARTDLRTKEFLEGYLTPLNIMSMLDAPIFKDGQLSGVLCIEQTETFQYWDMAEISYAVSVADCISLVYAQSKWLSEKQRIRYMERVDPLTCLENRLFFQKRIAQNIEHSSLNDKCAVILIGLDQFTGINKRFSYDFANKLLCEIARRLESISASSPYSLSRVGGDLFALWLINFKEQNELESVILKIQAQFTDEFKTFTNEVINLTASLGVYSCYIKELVDKDPLRKAEIAMLKAKNAGNGTISYFNPVWLIEYQEEASLEHEFVDALNNGDIVPFYQPIVKQDYQSSGFALEALVRWIHPTKGIISPYIILPIAKRLGLMGELGNAIFEQTCTDINGFLNAGLDLQRISVNISSEQLFSSQLVNKIDDCLKAHQVAASLVEFEIVEELMAGDFQVLSTQIEKLTDLGIQLSIDDFGTGYSSLSRLKNLNVSKLKIDKSFVDGLPNGEEDICIVKSIIGLAKGMGLDLVAEGVETQEQANWLFENGCDYLQGYLISKPIHATDIIKLMSQKNHFFNVENRP
ncbi:EAL domain-containing protein [Psychromonas sp. GE-S-Ul-11]|uniref:sensor domain-containing phosphodiesterase n=1 Tax=Psychromonas sp. GE-S-Ul-11 TaxID=3241170 RepID=UPI00390C437B